VYPNLVANDVLHMAVLAHHTPSEQMGVMDLHFRVASATEGSVTCLGVANSRLDSLQADWQAANSSEVILAGVKVSRLNKTSGRVDATGIVSPPTPFTGEIPGGIVPSQVAIVIRKMTAVVGRGGRGRVYFPFVSTTLVTTSGELDPEALGNVQAFAQNLIMYTGFTEGGISCTLEPILLHREPLPLTWTVIEEQSLSSRLGTQRRRGDYGRPNPML
jgi:hypothetical protein